MCYFSYRLPQQSHYICHNQTFFSLVMFVSILCIYFFLPVYNTKKNLFLFFDSWTHIMCGMNKTRSTNETHDQSRNSNKTELKPKCVYNHVVLLFLLCPSILHVCSQLVWILSWFCFDWNVIRKKNRFAHSSGNCRTCCVSFLWYNSAFYHWQDNVTNTFINIHTDLKETAALW